MNEVIGREVGGIDNQKIIKRKKQDICIYIFVQSILTILTISNHICRSIIPYNDCTKFY